MVSTAYTYNCQECGESFSATRQGRPLYCSNACKQKAYRKRKKQDKVARTMTLDMDQRLYAMKMLQIHPEMVDRFNAFHEVHGALAFSDLLDILKLITD